MIPEKQGIQTKSRSRNLSRAGLWDKIENLHIILQLIKEMTTTPVSVDDLNFLMTSYT